MADPGGAAGEVFDRWVHGGHAPLLAKPLGSVEHCHDFMVSMDAGSSVHPGADAG